MKKILFACDLDNTLIHSYHRKKDGDVCIEWLNGNEQGYISQAAVKLLAQVVDEVLFVPVTTRSIEQYLRIQWLSDTTPEYAVTTNGAIALENTGIDTSWKAESDALLEDYKGELQQMMSLLDKEEDLLRNRYVDGMYVFAIGREGADVPAIVKRYNAQSTLQVAASGKKVYFFPPAFNKGSALERLMAKNKPDFVICAGDTAIDLPMLERADLALCREEIFDEIRNPNKRIFADEKELLEYVLTFTRQMKKDTALEANL
uniref:HAD family hydrolase n=1 Tax=Eubacterium cellulosolvens TaxID=29322 RepID=UPI0004828D7A|nr:HAD hydrolase family protein [[Eubacterium] cellulosolvens]